MDPELIAYLDERFRETSQQIQGLQKETSERFASLDERFVSIDERFVSIDERFASMDERFDKLEEQLRHTDVKVERLHDHIRQVADGVAMGNERLDSFKQEVAREFSDTKALIKSGYKELDGRVTKLERRPRVQS